MRRYSIRKDFAQRRAWVVGLLCEGRPVPVISLLTGFSESMVRSAINSAMEELCFSTEAQLGAWWVNNKQALCPSDKCVKCGVNCAVKGRRDCRCCISANRKDQGCQPDATLENCNCHDKSCTGVRCNYLRPVSPA